MRYVINKNSHRILTLPKMHLGRVKKVSAVIIPNETWIYDLGNNDQEDWNKAFGLSFGWNHHRDSGRWGWSYNNVLQKIEWSHYQYADKDLLYNESYDVITNVNQQIKLDIVIEPYSEFISVVKYYADSSFITKVAIDKKAGEKCGYLLGFYFGGNKPAPHKIIANIHKNIFY